MALAHVKALMKRPAGDLAEITENDLVAVIQLANQHYYNSDKPLLSDNIYDMVKDKLEQMNPYHPILKHVGAIVNNDERKVQLPFWMGSMDKLKSDGPSVTKWKSTYTGAVAVSDKLDGNSGMYHFKNGEAKLFTRGNGEEGQTITHLLPFIQHIPDNDAVKNLKMKEVTVRGELIINKADFKKVKDLGANARNMVAGLLNAKLPNLEIAKYTQFVAYELMVPRHEPSTQFQLLKSWGFKVVDHSFMPTTDVSADKLSEILMKRRGESEFEIDGIIVAHDGIHNRVHGENPKHAFAFKSVAMMDRADVVVTGVEWNISKDGYIKPVVLFDGVSLSGAVVKRATGFNGKFIKDNMIGPGAKIEVMRSGDVIPYINKVIEKAREPGMPDVPYTWNESGVDVVVEVNANDEVAFKNIEFFFTTVKVPGVSAGILRKMHAAGIDTVEKVIKVTKAKLLQVDGFQDKSAAKVCDALHARFENIEPVVLMYASNAFGRGVGSTKIKLVADKFPAMLVDTKYKLDKSQLVGIEGIEAKTADKIITGLAAYWSFAKANDLVKYHKAAAQVQVHQPVLPPQQQNAFNGVAFVFTGVRNKDLEKYLTDRGGVIKSAVSKKINIVICKSLEAGSSKIEEARALGIKIYTMDGFMKDHNVIL